MQSTETTLITGANRGIGLALTQRYARDGGRILATTRGDAPDVAGVEWITLDVTDPSAFVALRDRLGDTPLDRLICNAGVYLDRAQSVDRPISAQDWATTFAVNVTGVFLTVEAVIANLRAAKGRIAIVSSQMGSSERAGGKSFAYRASKAASVNLGRNLAIDLAADGIAIGLYHPGWVQTGMGGRSADITAEASAEGLHARIATLGPATSGRFETWDGREMPF